MEQGSLRCDANISVRKKGEDLGTRCEIKNLNSIKNIVKAIEYEALRQVEIIENGGKVDQETRLFDANTGKTRTMRSKEDANDYRYFSDPDLLPVFVEDELINRLRSELPELPDAKIARYVKEFGLNQYDAEVIVADEEIAKFFEEASVGATPKIVANWISSELFAKLNKNNMELSDCKITAAMLKKLVLLIETGTISGKIAKSVFEEMFESGNSPEKIVKEKGLVQVSDTNTLEPIIDEIIAANPQSVEDYKNGKDKLFSFFVGQVMKQTSGKASPQMVNDLLKERLSK
jgi:aspartyl-tRNA(Asn)/glutamyl-tRNA(Gln) amidotransferase subunit B